jgi:hypothetical protein
MGVLSSFEVLNETIVPSGIPLPPGVPNPLVIQGFWVQISLPLGTPATSFNLIYRETTGFAQGAGRNALLAQFIDAGGNVNVFPTAQFFGSTANGFLDQKISAGQTLIYAIQAIPPASSTTTASLPQGGTGWRGYVELNAQNPNTLVATPTARLLYLTVNAPPVEAVYGVPTFSGGTRI